MGYLELRIPRVGLNLAKTAVIWNKHQSPISSALSSKGPENIFTRERVNLKDPVLGIEKRERKIWKRNSL